MSDFSFKNMIKNLKILKITGKSVTIGFETNKSKYQEKPGRIKTLKRKFLPTENVSS